MFTTPVLFLVFNRPDTTKKVFEKIREIRPAYLFIGADGARKDKPGEDKLCAEVREIVLSGIDWDCEIKTLFRDENLGCGKAVSQAITWFFDNVEEGIILEDDCLPDASFFKYCEILLERYRDQKNIMIISGDNFQDGIIRGDGTYYFTKYVHIWGWATWRRTWKLYDFNIKQWDSIKYEDRDALFTNMEENRYWKNIFGKIYRKEIDTWDYQLFFLSILNRGINVMPNRNLVTNIGFDQNSTHTKDPNHQLSKIKAFDYVKDEIPTIIREDVDADLFTFNNIYNGPEQASNLNNNKISLSKNYLLKVIQKLINIF